MTGAQNVNEVLRQIAQCEEAMKRAAERARDAVRSLHRATGIFGDPTQIDISAAEEAFAEIREARLEYRAEASRREELRVRLAELEREESAPGGSVSPTPAADSAAAPRSRTPVAPPPVSQAQPQAAWRTVAIVAIVGFSALVVAFTLLVVVLLGRQQQQPVAAPAAVRNPSPPEAAEPAEAPKIGTAEQQFDEARSKVQMLFSAGKPDDAIALLKELAGRYASDPIAPRIRAEIAAALYAKGESLASADKNAEALEVFRALVGDYPESDAARKAEKRMPDALLAVAKAHEDRAELEPAVATLESLVKEYPDSPAAAGARQALPALRVRLADNLLKLHPERAIALLQQVLSSQPPEADAATARSLLAAALLQRADQRGRQEQFKDAAADLRDAQELDPATKVSAGPKEAEALARAAVQAKEKLDLAGAVSLWKDLQQRYPQNRWLDEFGPQMKPLLDATAARENEPPPGEPAVLWALAQGELKADNFDAARPYLEKLLHAAGTVQAKNAADALAQHGYSTALTKLQAADLKGAQPLLEKIVADYPHAPAAEPAAAELARIKAAPQGTVYVPAGEFTLGLSKERVAEIMKKLHLPALMQEHWFGMQQPANRVVLKGYYIDEHPVTNEQYKAFVDATGHEPPPGADWQGKEIKPGCRDKPVTTVNWDDACAYAKWAGKRLPTEAEWEKAARGPGGWLFPWGDEFDRNRFGSAGMSDEPRTSPVDLAPGDRSIYGASDMIGNVLEWTADVFTPYPGADPTGLPFDANKRAVRGADAQTASLLSVLCLASTRAGRAPDTRLPTLGFRCAKDAG